MASLMLRVRRVHGPAHERRAARAAAAGRRPAGIPSLPGRTAGRREQRRDAGDHAPLEWQVRQEAAVARARVVHDVGGRRGLAHVRRHERRGHQVVRVAEHDERVARQVARPQLQLVPQEAPAEGLRARARRGAQAPRRPRPQARGRGMASTACCIVQRRGRETW